MVEIGRVAQNIRNLLRFLKDTNKQVYIRFETEEEYNETLNNDYQFKNDPRLKDQNNWYMKIYLKDDLQKLRQQEDNKYIVIGKIDKKHRKLWRIQS
mgnify:CR=1 FL=1